MNTTITTIRIQEIKILLTELKDTLKMSVEKAIKIGELLTEQKEELKHGQFLSWIETNFEMSNRTVEKYMNLFHHQNKIEFSSNLQEAYKKIKTIEKQEKIQKEKEDNKKIFEFKKTGIKPDGWERKHNYQYRKMLDDEEFEKRKDKVISEKKEREGKNEDDIDDDFEDPKEWIKLFESLIEQDLKDEELRKKLRLSNHEQNISQEVIFETIENFIDDTDNLSSMIERANNIIRFTRNIGIRLQQQTVA